LSCVAGLDNFSTGHQINLDEAVAAGADTKGSFRFIQRAVISVTSRTRCRRIFSPPRRPAKKPRRMGYEPTHRAAAGMEETLNWYAAQLLSLDSEAAATR